MLVTNSVLAQRHHLIEGTSYSILAKAFSEDGELLLTCLSDDSKRHLHSVIKVDSSATPSLSQVGGMIERVGEGGEERDDGRRVISSRALSTKKKLFVNFSIKA